MVSTQTPSTAVYSANKRLMQLRKQQQLVKRSSTNEPSPPWQDAALTKVAIEHIHSLPEHLGWNSKAVTSTLRQHAIPSAPSSLEIEPPISWPQQLTAEQEVTGSNPHAAHPSKTIKCYPDLAIAMLHHNLAATGRIWLLLRHLDKSGSGWVSIADAKSTLTDKHSDLHVCGWRQFRNLLAKGKGIFWTRDSERIWLKGVAGAAQALNVERLSGLPLQIPIAALTESIGSAKAHLYACFHSSRKQENPISRATLQDITTIPVRTQLIYEKKASIQKRHNFAIGTTFSNENAKERAWKNGRSVFKFIDYKGKLGKPRQAYVAWQLPNQYISTHELAAKGRMRKINQQLKDLVNKRAQGNSNSADCRLFYQDGASAAKAYNKHHPKGDMYWCSSQNRKRPFALWHLLAPVED